LVSLEFMLEWTHQTLRKSLRFLSVLFCLLPFGLQRVFSISDFPNNVLSISRFSRAYYILPTTPSLLTATMKWNLPSVKPQSSKFVPLLAGCLTHEYRLLGNPETRDCRSLPLNWLVSVMTRSQLREVSL